jgi:hypothetical protein
MESFKQCGLLYVGITPFVLSPLPLLTLYFINNIFKQKDALNETNPGMHIGDDTVLHIELAFKRMRDLFQCK